MRANAYHPDLLQSRLCSLPAELLTQVAAFAADGILNLRRTCKAAKEKTWHTFTKRFFTTRRLIISTSKLDELESISADARLAPCITNVVLYLNQYLWEDVMDARPEQVVGLMDAHHDQHLLLRTGNARHALATIFRRLVNLKSVALFPAYSIDACERGLSSEDNGNFHTNVWLAFTTAWLDSGLALTALGTSETQNGEHINPHYFSLITSMLGSLSPQLSALKTVNLGIATPKRPQYGQIWLRHFQDFLLACQNVEYLSLDFDREVDTMDEEYEALLTGLEWPTWQNLTDLWLVASEFRSSVLQQFLRNHERSIKHLRLEATIFPEEDSWLFDDSWVQTLISIPLETISFTVYELIHGETTVLHTRGVNIQAAVQNIAGFRIHCPLCHGEPRNHYLVSGTQDLRALMDMDDMDISP